MSLANKILIYVRGRRHEVTTEYVTYREIVDLAYPNGKHGPQYEYSVKWKDGPRGQESGVLEEGKEVKVVEKMRFYVKFTDKS